MQVFRGPGWGPGAGEAAAVSSALEGLLGAGRCPPSTPGLAAPTKHLWEIQDGLQGRKI